jgi:hypothetical protein
MFFDDIFGDIDGSEQPDPVTHGNRSLDFCIIVYKPCTVRICRKAYYLQQQDEGDDQFLHGDIGFITKGCANG